MKKLLVGLLALTTCAEVVATGAENACLTVVASGDNDLLDVLSCNKIEYRRYDLVTEALDKAEDGSGVLILADGYPDEPTRLDTALLDGADKKNLRLYIEYPSVLPDASIGQPRSTHVERAVVVTDFFGNRLQRLRIASINGLHYLPVDLGKHSDDIRTHLVAARVAGFDTAVYGLPEKTTPLLFELPGRDAMVATTKLSHFVTGRYAPRDSWQAIWERILSWLCPKAEIPQLRWTASVRATHGPKDCLPDDYELQAIRRGIEWYKRSGMIVHPSFEKDIVNTQVVKSLPIDAPAGTPIPVGDGSLGSLEAVISVVHQDGTQSISSVRRGDCVCETAMAMAFGADTLDNKSDSTIAQNLLDFYLLQSDARKKERGDPEHGAYGLIAWGITTPAWYKANYGDDNARQMLGTLAVAGLTGAERWDEAMMMCLLANLRTTGQYGFRTGRLDIGPLGQNGWQSYFRGKPISYSPHFESYLWACYLWAYEQTGYEMFLDRAETALTMTMAQYTDGWRWCNGLAQEKARIILPLAWLVRAKDTPETRAMLRKAVDGVLALQDECGAIREELGLPGRGIYPPPPSNDAYGTNEASLIAKNGDPVSDLLYTTNFAFLGLHEAAAATGDRDIIEAENRLAEFLCRIQVRSDSHPALDGGWFRAFDFQRWEHWGCNADHGWGAWAIESGWTQGWITAVLAMRQMETSLWDVTHDSKVERHFKRLRREMIPDDVIDSIKPQKIEHSAVGSTVRLTRMPNPGYPGKGPATLADGILSNTDHTTGDWLGFHGEDMEAVVDLGNAQPIKRITARFLQSVAVGIYLPEQIEFAISEDGQTYKKVVTARAKAPDYESSGPKVSSVVADLLEVRARYIRVRAKNLMTIPPDRPAAGRTAWLFADEIMVD